jgi:hypothetical protein
MARDSIPLRMWNLYPSEYVLRIELKDVDPDREVWLIDRVRGRSERVIGDRLDYAFQQASGVTRKDDLVLAVLKRVPVAGDDGGAMLLYPNPSVSGKVQFAIPMQGLSAEGGWMSSMVELVEASGVVVQSGSVRLDGRGRGDLDVSRLRSGSYVLRVWVGEKTFTTKMIRQ